MIDRNKVEKAVYNTYMLVANGNEEYINFKTNAFMNMVCSESESPNNPYLKSSITEQSIKDVSFAVLDKDCQEFLYNILNIKE